MEDYTNPIDAFILIGNEIVNLLTGEVEFIELEEGETNG